MPTPPFSVQRASPPTVYTVHLARGTLQAAATGTTGFGCDLPAEESELKTRTAGKMPRIVIGSHLPRPRHLGHSNRKRPQAPKALCGKNLFSQGCCGAPSPPPKPSQLLCPFAAALGSRPLPPPRLLSYHFQLGEALLDSPEGFLSWAWAKRSAAGERSKPPATCAQQRRARR